MYRKKNIVLTKIFPKIIKQYCTRRRKLKQKNDFSIILVYYYSNLNKIGCDYLNYNLKLDVQIKNRLHGFFCKI